MAAPIPTHLLLLGPSGPVLDEVIDVRPAQCRENCPFDDPGSIDALALDDGRVTVALSRRVRDCSTCFVADSATPELWRRSAPATYDGPAPAPERVIDAGLFGHTPLYAVQNLTSRVDVLQGTFGVAWGSAISSASISGAVAIAGPNEGRGAPVVAFSFGGTVGVLMVPNNTSQTVSALQQVRGVSARNDAVVVVGSGTSGHPTVVRLDAPDEPVDLLAVEAVVEGDSVADAVIDQAVLYAAIERPIDTAD